MEAANEVKRASKRVEFSLQTTRLQPSNETASKWNEQNERNKRVKAMTRQQLAAYADVSTRTLNDNQYSPTFRESIRRKHE